MKRKYFENRKGFLKSVFMGVIVMLTISLFFTGCGTTNKISETSAMSVSDSAKSHELQNVQNDCALLHIYRKSSMSGAAIGYDLYLDNNKIFRITNKSKTTIKLTKEGLITIMAKTEKKVEIPLNIEFGKEYYVRCGIKMGVMVGRPDIEIVDNNTGKLEFEKIPVKK